MAGIRKNISLKDKKLKLLYNCRLDRATRETQQKVWFSLCFLPQPNQRKIKLFKIYINMKKLLFICSQNRLRSPTAEAVFSEYEGLETDSAGLNKGAETPLSSEAIAWADLIFVMEKSHKQKLSHKFKPYLKNKRIICLDIPDEYDYMQPELVELLKKKVLPFLSNF